MSSFNHAIGFVEHKIPEAFNSFSKFVILFGVRNYEQRWFEHFTSSIMSHNRPGVATNISTPRSKTRLCFWLDIPPTIVAQLTWGESFFGCVVLPAPFGWTRAGGGRQEFRCTDTCKASSRVGAKMRARNGRFTLLFGRGCNNRCCRIGSPYASVLPEPWASWAEK